MQDLSIALIQADLAWEDPQENLSRLSEKIAAVSSPADLILLPEMFSTGFTMQVKACAEPPDGRAMDWMRKKAAEMDSVVAGSILTREGDRYYNRFVWMRPDGSHAHYDKRHLFSMAGEDRTMTRGRRQVIVQLKGWKVSLQVCYDLRFPVWSKNSFRDGRYAYDVLIYVANWPESRKQAYQRLLPARAIENQAYVVWVNRVGMDGKGIGHSGDSGVYDPMGNALAMAGSGKEELLQMRLPADVLNERRSKFHIGPDWDAFSIEE